MAREPTSTSCRSSTTTARSSASMTERALARRYIRESREASTLDDAPTTRRARSSTCSTASCVGAARTTRSPGRVWVHVDGRRARRSGDRAPGDVVVVGNRADAQRAGDRARRRAARAHQRRRRRPTRSSRWPASAGPPSIVSPLDSYVSGRMITLAAPCRALMDARAADRHAPTTCVADVSEQIKEIHYRAAVAVDAQRRPDRPGHALGPGQPAPRRRVLLVDHAEQAQSVAGRRAGRDRRDPRPPPHRLDRDDACRCAATFDPVGSTATLVVERFRQNGMEPSRPTATMLLGAVLSDTVILNSPTTTERDRAVVEYLERVLALDAAEFGREMFEATSDVSERQRRGDRHARRQGVRGRRAATRSAIAQIETVGQVAARPHATSCSTAMREARERRGHALYALMVTDILAKGTDAARAPATTRPLERAFGDAGARRRDRPARRDEPQEAGRAEAARGDVAGATRGGYVESAMAASTGASPHSCSSR